ncbi:hypothetical protein PVAP13_9NG482842 [Panicum virgatum]|uniref:Uncharacterized protein n=1 Tax=Panicum virgatum TaxID=38727 RepID=A0A8T0MQV2_PANVG|nr:hypothetical protein PVAP13_9NG482842 [Panicum virgatum]
MTDQSPSLPYKYHQCTSSRPVASNTHTETGAKTAGNFGHGGGGTQERPWRDGTSRRSGAEPAPPPRHPLGRVRRVLAVPQATARAGAVPADPEDAHARRRRWQQQVPGERAEAGRVRERAGRAAEPGAGPATAGLVVAVRLHFHNAAMLPAPGRAGRPGRGRVPVHGAARQRAGRRPARPPRRAQRPRQLLRQEAGALCISWKVDKLFIFKVYLAQLAFVNCSIFILNTFNIF